MKKIHVKLDYKTQVPNLTEIFSVYRLPEYLQFLLVDEYQTNRDIHILTRLEMRLKGSPYKLGESKLPRKY